MASERDWLRLTEAVEELAALGVTVNPNVMREAADEGWVATQRADTVRGYGHRRIARDSLAPFAEAMKLPRGPEREARLSALAKVNKPG